MKELLAILAQEDARFFRCPEGHALPRRTERGRCTPVWCCDLGVAGPPRRKGFAGEDPGAVEGKMVLGEVVQKIDPVRRALPDAIAGDAKERQSTLAKNADSFHEVATTEGRAEELIAIGRAQGASEARAAYLPPPAEVDDAKEAARQGEVGLALLVPRAVHELRFDLHYGDPDSRRSAAREVLDRAGFAKADKRTNAGSPLIILVGADVKAPPWRASRGGDAAASSATVDVAALNPKKEK